MLSIVVLFFLNILFVVVNSNGICSLHTNNATNEIVALILARGGSKGIPKKNLVQINGISLIGRTLNNLHASKAFTNIWVSTEDKEIRHESKKYGARIHDRPPLLASDDASSMAAVQDFIGSYPEFEAVALFQCTSAFLKVWHIQKAYRLFKSSDCVFAATRSFKLRWAMDMETNGYKPLNFNPTARPRRQDWNGELVETGMFYFAKRSLIEAGSFQNNNCKIVEISKEDSLEIDDHEDLKLAKSLLKNC